MLKKIHSKDLYVADHDWLVSRFHFSFAEYYNPSNINFGVLRVLNDDLVKPDTGFETHPHKDMEIVSYCVEGELTHQDSMGKRETMGRGDVQYMTAGTGITHSEMNESPDKILRFLQIWILPDKKGHIPKYSFKRFSYEERYDRLLQIASGQNKDNTIHIDQDVNIFISEIDYGKQLEYFNEPERQSYLVCIEGCLDINGIELNEHDAMKIIGNEKLSLKSLSNAHFTIIDMAKEF